MGSHTRTSHGIDGHSCAAGTAAVPSLVQWLVTTECQLTCPHCLASASSDSTESMPLALALSLVDQIADAAIPELIVTGGEPLGYLYLPEILARMAERGVRWSLNTARMPAGAALDAIERHPPEFVAVSLDGPRRVHDAFRGRIGAFNEALESMRLFRAFGSHVAAGTTVTRRNIGKLMETLAVVQGTAAHSWGLHILVPEGRARHRPDLTLCRADLRRLVRFVQEKRTYVKVEIADELGHCGDYEPLLRDVPMTCGAGRMMCVVLPDGEVVPCTTLDRAASAGNVQDRPLLEIWRDGFAALRRRVPADRCAGCDYFSACGGGCWLQSRERRRCFKDVWESDRARGRAAGLVVALGLLSAQGCGSSAPAPDARAASHSTGPTDEPAGAGEAPAEDEPGSDDTPVPVAAAATDDEAAPPALELVVPTEGQDGVQDPPLHVSSSGGATINLTAEMGGALEAAIVRITLEGPSASVAADVQRATPAGATTDPAWVFVQAHASGRLPHGLAARAQAIRDSLGTSRPSLGLCALGWRVLSEPLLDGAPPEVRSAADRAALRQTLAALARATETWRSAIFRGRLDPYLARGNAHIQHRFMMTMVRQEPPPDLRLANDTIEERWGPEGQRATAGWLASHPYAEALRLGLSGAGAGLTILTDGHSGPVGADASMGVFDLLVVPPQGASLDVRWRQAAPLTIQLPAGAELAYVDVLRLVDEQHRATLQPLAGRSGGNPMLLPRMRARANARAWLADFWLF